MSFVVRLMDIHLPFGIIVATPHAKAFHRGLPIATTGSIVSPPFMVPIFPFPCIPYIPCCLPNVSIGTSKLNIMGMPVVKAGDVSIPCGISASIAKQAHFSTV